MKENKKPPKKKNPPMPVNHKKRLYDTGSGIDIYGSTPKGKRPRPIGWCEYTELFAAKPQNDGLTILAGHGIRTELVEEIKNDPSVVKAARNQVGCMTKGIHYAR